MLRTGTVYWKKSVSVYFFSVFIRSTMVDYGQALVACQFLEAETPPFSLIFSRSKLIAIISHMSHGFGPQNVVRRFYKVPHHPGRPNLPRSRPKPIVHRGGGVLCFGCVWRLGRATAFLPNPARAPYLMRTAILPGIHLNPSDFRS